MRNSKFMEKFYRFMYGRYGNDQLNMFLSVLSIALAVCSIVLQIVIPNPVAKNVVFYSMLAVVVGLFVITICRTMSKKIHNRRVENGRFIHFSRALKRFFTFNTSSKTASHNKDTDLYIFRDCTKCSATLRLPRKKGRNRVKCPKCSHSFYVKSK